MMFQAKLKNKAHPEYGVVTVPFPLHRDNYSHYIRLTKILEIGSATERDCWVNEIDGAWPVLERLENTQVNLDDLDYLAKRLDSFDIGEAAKFQAMAERLDLHDIKDFINLTFCCQQATVITDFSDLGGAGRNHYMNLHGGCASTEELNSLNGYETARQLIASGDGVVTQYGVVYDNGMEMSQLYDGKHCSSDGPKPLLPQNHKERHWLKKSFAVTAGHHSEGKYAERVFTGSAAHIIPAEKNAPSCR